jgi:hypothetical protein
MQLWGFSVRQYQKRIMQEEPAKRLSICEQHFQNLMQSFSLDDLRL